MASTLAEVYRGSATTLAETGFQFSERSVTGERGAHDILLRAPDLATAQRERRRIQSSMTGEPPSVLLEVEAVVAETYSQARRKLADTDGAATEQLTIRYVGTPVGLAGLIADIAAAEVADGVVITPVPMADTPTLILEQTIPWLQDHNLIASVVNLGESV
ncbi:hypothetical protein ACQI4L_20440 [Mycolicibacterium litorale]|uniref:hypothetical protein n=1 Tax=Mycolicibacterium litorale TaxID=758802 RepID=UPI003CEA4425